MECADAFVLFTSVYSVHENHDLADSTPPFSKTMSDIAEGVPDVENGIEYWTTQPASYNGVLGKPPRERSR